MINVTSNNERESIINDMMPDLTPLLDVMFMLIIFLVLTTNTMQQAFDITLPEDKESASTPLEDNRSITITIFEGDKRWAINKDEYQNFDELQKALVELKDKNPDKDFIIYGDKSATIDKLMMLLTFMRSNGIEAADIVME